MNRDKFPGSPLPKLLDDYVDSARVEFEHITHTWSESPIEACFLGALLCLGWHDNIDEHRNIEISAEYYSAGINPEYRVLVGPCLTEFEGDYCLVQASTSVGGRTMRIDFLFREYCSDTWLAVELDGHEFHERTKEQARKDKSRDRILSAAGWRTARFTGSEVWSDPKSCVREVQKLLKTMADKANADRAATYGKRVRPQ